MGRKKQDPDMGPVPSHENQYRTGSEQENICISLAMDLAEKKLRDGTASSQLISQFVRYGTERERHEREKLMRENQLLEAKTDAIKSAERVEELYSKAIQAMQLYSGD